MIKNIKKIQEGQELITEEEAVAMNSLYINEEDTKAEQAIAIHRAIEAKGIKAVAYQIVKNKAIPLYTTSDLKVSENNIN